MITGAINYLLRKLCNRLTAESKKTIDAYNWDNCDPCTNGEYYFINKNALNWNNCLDIGANEGEYASKILETNPKCKIICFEPNTILINKIYEKGVKEIHNCIVGDLSGKVSININTNDSTQSSIYRSNCDTQKKIITSITIDEFLFKNNIDRISFVKIDTEGHELSVLKGAYHSLDNRKIDMLQFEYGGTYTDAGTTLEQVFNLLKDNYIICHLYPQGILPVIYSEDLESYRYSNWIALSRDLYK